VRDREHQDGVRDHEGDQQEDRKIRLQHEAPSG